MSKFKVGQRVVVADEAGDDWAGREGVVNTVNERTLHYMVALDNNLDGLQPFAENELAVIDDPVHEGVDRPDATSPAHYDFNGVQVIDITRHLSFPLGNVVKYVTRAGRKGDALEDLLKARKYLDWAIEDAENERPSV